MTAPDIPALLEEAAKYASAYSAYDSEERAALTRRLHAAAAWLREQKPVRCWNCGMVNAGTDPRMHAAPPPPVDEGRMRCCECGEKFTLVNCGTCLICRGAKMYATEKKPPVDVAGDGVTLPRAVVERLCEAADAAVGIMAATGMAGKPPFGELNIALAAVREAMK